MVNGFGGIVTFGISGLPTGANVNFAPPQVNGAGASVVTVSADATATPVGTYPLTISATSGGTTRTATLTLVVVDQDFSLSLAGNPNVMMMGSAGETFHVTTNAINGFT